MAAYFHGNSEIQAGGDGLQTLILMNPGYVGYSDTQPPQPPPGGSNFMFLNSSNSGIPHAPPSQTQHFVGIPLQATTSTTTTTTTSYQATHPPSFHSQQDLSALHGFLPRVQYNLYNPSMDLTAARDITRAQHGLSLSLSSQHPPRFGSFMTERESPSQHLVATKSSVHGDDIRVSGESTSSASGVSNGVTGAQSMVLSSMYLKAAQELLEEVVNVGKEVKSATESGKSSFRRAKSTVGESSAVGENNGKRSSELTTAERQEIQMKKAKLVNMLDEVEQRYKQYHRQMQIVISVFEQAAGIDSAKTYTALALQTISKKFRCLKDSILDQIRSSSNALDEEENLEGKVEVSTSRLKYVDNQIRQQKALQQLGMIQQPSAWRPQRGLPERSVSVLRAWLFEHFLHPYPKDSDKLMLAKQTGLTRSQVSNWFINARVRLWKPMVEEMYTEETKEHGKKGSEEKISEGRKNEESTSKSTAAPQQNILGNENQNNNFIAKQDSPIDQNIMTPTDASFRNQSVFDLIGSSEIESVTQGRRKKPRSSVVPSTNMDSNSTNANNDQMTMEFSNERQSRDGFTLMATPTNLIGEFGSYPMGEIRRFGTQQFHAPYSGNGTVSLTLGLPHGENLSGTHPNFLPNHSIRGVEIGETNEFNDMNTPTSAHSTSINIQNRKRYAEQLLPDFVT